MIILENYDKNLEQPLFSKDSRSIQENDDIRKSIYFFFHNIKFLLFS